VSLVVLLGGARAGKSALAQELAARWEGPVAYVATAEARDEEMAERIERHRRERPEGWTTVEEPLELRAVLERLEHGQAAVVDCLTLWVSNALERGD
jgi:adenosyl cobinamide kinase/adenosyl cobinamide phosphate guanylyltransferase